MDDKKDSPPAGDTKRKDTAEYSSSKAPETRREAEEKETFTDWRLIPGGRHGSAVDIGMTAMDRSEVPSAALDPAQARHGDSREGD